MNGPVNFFWLSYLHWNPSRVVFTLPLIEHDIVWYGVLFACGFIVTYLVLRSVLLGEVKRLPSLKKAFEDPAIFIADKMVLYVVIGLVIGARLGYVFFYGWPLYRENPLDIFKIWLGGLASHGACAGILMATWFLKIKFYKKCRELSYSYFLDLLAIISGFFACFIRLGNFVNQEIVGKATNLPWAIVFLNPFDGAQALPRHPVQLYEAFFYLLLALSLVLLWGKKVWPMGRGLYASYFLSLLFTFRFFVEFLKEPQGYVLPLYKGLTMGQYLSLPFVFGGCFLLWRYYKSRKELNVSN